MRLLYLLPLCLFIVAQIQAKEILTSRAAKVGVSAERLTRVIDLANHYVEEDKYSGLVTLIARDGKIILKNAVGNYGVDDARPLETDTLFRIYSMTKPITAVAAMILYERGLFHLDDPVSKHLPEFSDQKVMYDGQLRPPASKMTIRQLFTHTAGFSYGWAEDNPVDLLYKEAKLFDSNDLAQFIKKLTALPLRFEPGTRYHYSVSYDVLGALIERLSGLPLDVFFKQEIFTPLGMQDTFFEVPSNKVARLASDQIWDYELNQIKAIPVEQRRRFDQVGLFFGGGGLVSTAEDFFRFCQMILNGGQYKGGRLLSPKTVALMSADHLTPEVRTNGVGQYPSQDLYTGQSMALGFGVAITPQLMPDVSSLGELSWGGLAGTKFWIDPQENLIGIALVQLYQSPWPLRSDLKTASYQALEELR